MIQTNNTGTTAIKNSINFDLTNTHTYTHTHPIEGKNTNALQLFFGFFSFRFPCYLLYLQKNGVCICVFVSFFIPFCPLLNAKSKRIWLKKMKQLQKKVL